MAPKKPSAADRTVDMFAPKAEPVPEVIQDDAKDGRLPTYEEADRCRERAFEVQEWTTKCFGIPEEKGNQFRMTHRGEHYYVETVSNSRYVGLMVHERDLLALTTVMVNAVRARGGK